MKKPTNYGKMFWLIADSMALAEEVASAPRIDDPSLAVMAQIKAAKALAKNRASLKKVLK